MKGKVYSITVLVAFEASKIGRSQNIPDSVNCIRFNGQVSENLELERCAYGMV